MYPRNYIFFFQIGEDFRLDLTYQPDPTVLLDVSGYGGEFVVKDQVGGTTLISGSVTNGEIVRVGPKGIFQITLLKADVEAALKDYTDVFAYLTVWPVESYPTLNRDVVISGGGRVFPL